MTRDLTTDNEEYERLVNAGMTQSGEQRKRGVFVPTVEVSNSDKLRNGLVVPQGHFRKTVSNAGVKSSSDLGDQINGVVLKVRYSFEASYDPTGRDVYFFSQEFDTYNDPITAFTLDPNRKPAIYFQGTYKEWQEGNSTINPRTQKRDNLYDSYVNLYILEGGNTETPNIFKLKLGGKSMGSYYEYMNGNKIANIPGLHEQKDKLGRAIHLHTHLHVIDIAPFDKPDKSGVYYAAVFSFSDGLNIADLTKVIQLQRELNEALSAMEGRRQAPAEYEQEEPQAELPTIQIEEEIPLVGMPVQQKINIDDVPFS
jgi:hypothetical protein